MTEKMAQPSQIGFDASPPYSYSPPPSHPYPQPPPHPYPQPSPPPQQPNIIVTSTAFGSNTQHVVCPHCHANISTRVETEANMKTHLIALLLCSFGCCCLPYCINNCLVKKHYCPACGSYLGSCEN